MLNITQVMRIRGGKVIKIDREKYPNTLDAIRFHYVKLEIPERVIPIELGLNISQVYLDRLEAFIKDEIDLPEFYAFASGKSKASVRERVGYPMANNAFQFILDAVEGKNQNEGPKIKAEIKLPATGGIVSNSYTRLFHEFGHSNCLSVGDRKEPGEGPSKTESE